MRPLSTMTALSLALLLACGGEGEPGEGEPMERPESASEMHGEHGGEHGGSAMDEGGEHAGHGGAGTGAMTELRRFPVEGDVMQISDARDRIDIDHEDVEGYMPAMTMPFFPEEASLLEGLSVGDRVEFTFEPREGGRHVITAITKK